MELGDMKGKGRNGHLSGKHKAWAAAVMADGKVAPANVKKMAETRMLN